MDSLFTTFLLFLAALVAIITFVVVPMIPATGIVLAAAIALAIGVWWHWTQFAVDYRTATWPEQLRSYSSYVLVFLVILASYGVYAFAASGATVQEVATRTTSAVRNVGARSLSAASNALLSEGEEGAVNVMAANAGVPASPLNLLGNLGGAVAANKKNTNFFLG